MLVHFFFNLLNYIALPINCQNLGIHRYVIFFIVSTYTVFVLFFTAEATNRPESREGSVERKGNYVDYTNTLL